MLSHLLLQVPQVVDSAKVAKMQSILNPDSLIQKAPTNISELEAFPWTEILQGLVSKVVTFCFHLVIAVLVFYAGKFVIGKFHAILKVFLQCRNIEPSLATFLLSLLKITLMFILIVSVIGILGIVSGFVGRSDGGKLRWRRVDFAPQTLQSGRLYCVWHQHGCGERNTNFPHHHHH